MSASPAAAALAEAGPQERLAPFRFGARFPVDLADTDLGGVVYYGRYAHLIDRALVAYRRHLGIPALGWPGHLFIVRSLEIDYRAPARFEDRLEVLVRTAGLRAGSHRVEARIERLEPEPGLVAEARLEIAGVERPGGRPSRLPGPLREAIAAFEGLEGGR